MYILKKLTLVIFFLIVSNNLSFASQNVRFADIDLIVQNSEIGKKTLSKIEKINKYFSPSPKTCSNRSNVQDMPLNQN